VFSFKQLEVMGITLMAAWRLPAVSCAAFVLYPYHPMKYLAISLNETEVCPGTEMLVKVSYYLEPELFDSVDSFEVRANWIAEDVPGNKEGAVTPAAIATVPAEALNAGWHLEEEGRVVRRAPLEPGVWQLDNEITVRGALFYLPKLETTRVTSPESLTVTDNATCEDLEERTS